MSQVSLPDFKESYGGYKCQLVLEVVGGFEDFMEDLKHLSSLQRLVISTAKGGYIYDVLALVSFLAIRTSAGRLLGNPNTVNIPRSARNVNCFLWQFFSAASGPVDDKHPSYQSLVCLVSDEHGVLSPLRSSAV